jgi:hypothetical protein
MNKFELIPIPDHEAVIERIAAEALEEARKAANAARRSIGQILRRYREKSTA